MIKKLPYKLKNEFIRNVLILFSGSGIAVIIPVLLSPILTRLFSPTNFGIFSIYASFVSIISSFITLRYELSVMVIKKKNNILNIFLLCLIVITINILILLIIGFLIGKDRILKLFNAKDLDGKIWLLFLGIFLTSILQCICNILYKLKKYNLLARNKIYSVIISSFVKIFLGSKNLESLALITSYVVEVTFSNLNMGLRLIFSYIKEQKISIKKIFILAKKYIRFPLYNLPCDVIYLIASHIHIFLFLKYFSEEIVGIISFTSKTILTPMMIFATSFSHVFFQKISEYNDIIELKIFYLNSLFLILLITPIIIIVGYLIPIKWIIYLFGYEWKSLHMYIFPITIWVSGDFIISSIYTIFIKLQRFFYLFIFNFSSLVITLILFFIYYSKGYNSYQILLIISISRYFVYIILSGYSVRFFNKKLKLEY